MGRTGFCYREAERLLHPPPSIPPPALLLLLLLSALLLRTGEGQVQTPQCRIQKCTTDFVSLTSHLSPALDGFDTEFCKALRAYSACTHRTSKSCRGNLVFHSAVLGISDLMSQRNCSKDGPMSSTHPETPVEPCNYHSRHQGPRPGGGEHAHPTYLFCGLFGDPHLRTFRDHFQTCKVEGAWPLIDNNFLSVQVTNVPVVLGSSATATNKITIIFKPYQKCTDQKVYQAVTDDLPAAFVDGTLNSVDATTKSLWIIEKEAARHVEIYAAYIGVTIVVRQLGRYLTLAVRMPEELAMAFDETQDLQLCMNGCPSSERIDQNGLLPLPALGLQHPSMQQSRPGLAAAFSLEAAMSKCREQLEVKYIYFHCCVFDLLTTGDANFTEAAYNALKDMETLHPMHKHAAEGHGGSWHIFPRSDAGPVRVTTVWQLLLLCCLLTLLF